MRRIHGVLGVDLYLSFTYLFINLFDNFHDRDNVFGVYCLLLCETHRMCEHLQF